MIRRTLKYMRFFLLAPLAMACSAEGDNTGLEYAPNMYHSVPYDPLRQITEETAGTWVDSNDDEYGEYYNSNPYNPHNMTMREPAPHSVKRDKYLPYRYDKDSLIRAGEELTNPLPDSAAYVLEDGKMLYQNFCQHCHGVNGEGDGAVAEAFPGIANLKGAALANASQGHIFHVITHGKGRMAPHAAQINIEARWKIAAYVKRLQQQ